MNRRSLRDRVRRWLTFAVVALLASAAIVGGALYTKMLFAVETSQATMLVADGQRALAHDDRATASLDFERARWLAPRAKIVRRALASIGIKDAEPLVPRALRIVSAQEWTAIAVASGWLAGTALLMFIWQHKPSKKPLTFALLVGTVFVAGNAAIGIEATTSPPAITIANEKLLVAPYASAESEAALPAGTMVILGTPHEDFVQAEDGNGTKGWVRRKDVELIARSPEG